MKLEYVPLLKVQRDLYDIPRGFERFREYIRTMTEPGSGELKVPLVAMNPMGKDHLPPFLDHLLAIDADGVGARALADAEAALADEAGDYRACLVVSDDLKGGWTNRYASEYSYRFEQRAFYRRAWLAANLWTSTTRAQFDGNCWSACIASLTCSGMGRPTRSARCSRRNAMHCAVPDRQLRRLTKTT